MAAETRNPWRSDFPILETTVKGKPLVYLDNAATTQKPQVVLDRVSDFLAGENANIHRGVYYLSMNATDAYDQARETVAKIPGSRFVALPGCGHSPQEECPGEFLAAVEPFLASR